MDKKEESTNKDIKIPSDIVPYLDVNCSCISKQLFNCCLPNLIAINSGIKPSS